LYYFFKGKLRRAWSSEELKFYLSILLVVITIISAILISNNIYDIETSIRTSAFTVISLVTTTGFVTADYTAWTPSTEMICFFLLFIGACAGSTSGGIKMIRHLVFFKTALLEFKRILHPRAFIRMKIDGEVVTSRILMHILVFLLFYLILFGLGVFVMSFFLINDPTPFKSSLGAIATALGNVGPSIGSLGPVDNFSSLSSGAKLFLSVFMVIGRLEIFTIIIILTPYFWRIK
jgi:trk system potassium uptake protein TrkH